MNFLEKLFWRKTIDDLVAEMAAGKRKEITACEAKLAKAYERQSLPKDIRFPKANEIYQTLQDFEVDYLTTYTTPYTGGGKATLPKGEKIRVTAPLEQEPLSISCVPLNYEELHEKIVPLEERENSKYASYHLSIGTVELNHFFKLV